MRAEDVTFAIFKGAGPLFTFKKDNLTIFVNLGGIFARFGL